MKMLLHVDGAIPFSDVVVCGIATANNEGSRDAIEMATLPNAATLHQDKEAIVKPGPGATGITTRPVVDSFDLSEDQIKLSRGLFTFNRITGSFNGGKKK